MKAFITTLCAAACAAAAHTQPRPMTLKECIDYAASRNITIKRSENAARQQRVELSAARDSRLPDLNAGASEQVNFGRGLNEENMYVNRNTRNTSFSLSASVPLFTGMRIPNQIAASKLNLEAAMADLERARQDVSLSVASAYLQAACTREIMSVSANQTALSKIQEERLRKMMAAGSASETDVAEASSQVAQDELAQTQAQADYMLALLDLSQLLELPSPDALEIVLPVGDVPETLPPPPAEIYGQAVSLKPGIKAEQLRLQASEKNINVAKAGYFPTLSFGAGLSTGYYKTSGMQARSFGDQLSDNLNKYLGLTLSIPVFNRLETRNSVRRAKLQLEEQSLALDQTKKNLYKEIQQAYYNAVNAEAKYRSSLAAEKAAGQNFTLVTRKYENSKANATEFAEAKTRHVNAAINRLQAKYEYIFRMKIINFYQGADIS